MEMKNKKVADLVAKMSLEQKVGAVMTLSFTGTIPGPHIYKFITEYHCGGLRLTPHARGFGKYVAPDGKAVAGDIPDDKGYKTGIQPPYATASQYRDTLERLQQVARSRPLGLPLHFSFDQEGGDSANFCFGGVNYFPKPMGIRATGDSRYAYLVAKAVARQSRAAGFNWVHSPVLDVNSNPQNSEIGIRSYSDDPAVVAEYATQACRGYQEGGLIATGKHFPGRGASCEDAHFTIPVIEDDWDTLYNRDLAPYRELIRQGLLPSIMIAHTVFKALDPDHIATVSPRILKGLLREEMGFEGVITTDSMTMGGVVNQYGVAEACAMALQAGADIVLMKSETSLVDETFRTIRQYVEDGRIPMQELDEKVYRILDMKDRYGLFDAQPDTAPEEVLQEQEIRQLSEKVARRSVLVARDCAGVLPLTGQEKLLVIEQCDTTKFLDQGNYPGMLFHNCCRYAQHVEYLETKHCMDAEDEQRIMEKARGFDTILVTNYFRRDLLANTELVSKICALSGKRVIVVTNTPYRLSIPDNADTVILSFSPTIRHAEVTAGVLYGKEQPLGSWPVKPDWQ